MSTPLLDLKGVFYGINGRKILSDLSWTVCQGENWAILGPNGAGKTTLLKIICGFLWPNSGGKVTRKGQSHADLGVLRRSIGWVTSALVADVPRGERVLDTVLSGKYAQLGLWSLPDEEPGQDDFAAAKGCLQEHYCEHLTDRRFGTLSQGEQQMVLVCRAQMARPYLLILDEPCAGMDPGARELFLSSLSRLAQNRSAPALIYVTHHVEEILPEFNHVLAMKDGKVLVSGVTEDVLRKETFRDLYGIGVQLVERNGRYWPIATEEPTAH